MKFHENIPHPLDRNYTLLFPDGSCSDACDLHVEIQKHLQNALRDVYENIVVGQKKKSWAQKMMRETGSNIAEHVAGRIVDGIGRVVPVVGIAKTVFDVFPKNTSIDYFKKSRTYHESNCSKKSKGFLNKHMGDVISYLKRWDYEDVLRDVYREISNEFSYKPKLIPEHLASISSGIGYKSYIIKQIMTNLLSDVIFKKEYPKHIYAQIKESFDINFPEKIDEMLLQFEGTSDDSKEMICRAIAHAGENEKDIKDYAVIIGCLRHFISNGKPSDGIMNKGIYIASSVDISKASIETKKEARRLMSVVLDRITNEIDGIYQRFCEACENAPDGLPKNLELKTFFGVDYLKMIFSPKHGSPSEYLLEILFEKVKDYSADNLYKTMHGMRSFARSIGATDLTLKIDGAFNYLMRHPEIDSGLEADMIRALPKNILDEIPLIVRAAARGDRNGLYELLAKNHDPNDKGPYNRTALMYAIESGYDDCAKALISRGADVNAEDLFGRTPLIESIFRGDRDMLDLLLSLGASVNAVSTNGNGDLTPLRASILFGNIGMLMDVTNKYGLGVFCTPYRRYGNKVISEIKTKNNAHKTNRNIVGAMEI